MSVFLLARGKYINKWEKYNLLAFCLSTCFLRFQLPTTLGSLPTYSLVGVIAENKLLLLFKCLKEKIVQQYCLKITYSIILRVYQWTRVFVCACTLKYPICLTFIVLAMHVKYIQSVMTKEWGRTRQLNVFISPILFVLCILFMSIERGRLS